MLGWAGRAVLSGNDGAARRGAELLLRETKRSSCDQRGNRPWCCGLRVPPTPTAKCLGEPKGGCWEVGSLSHHGQDSDTDSGERPH